MRITQRENLTKTLKISLTCSNSLTESFDKSQKIVGYEILRPDFPSYNLSLTKRKEIIFSFCRQFQWKHSPFPWYFFCYAVFRIAGILYC